jgi:hypothetical protein
MKQLTRATLWGGAYVISNVVAFTIACVAMVVAGALFYEFGNEKSH